MSRVLVVRRVAAVVRWRPAGLSVTLMSCVLRCVTRLGRAVAGMPMLAVTRVLSE